MNNHKMSNTTEIDYGVIGSECVMNNNVMSNATKTDYKFVGNFSDEVKRDFLNFLDDLRKNDHNCGVVSHTNHSNHSNW